MKETIKLTLKPLSKESFDEYGDILSMDANPYKVINDGYAQKYANLCTMDTNDNGGHSCVHIYLAKKRTFPLSINMLEKHPFFSQAFIPRSSEPFLVVIAHGEETPDLTTLQAFITNGNQGVHYKKGLWHFPLISLKDNEQFIVIDRTDGNIVQNRVEECIEHYFQNEQIILNLKD